LITNTSNLIAKELIVKKVKMLLLLVGLVSVAMIAYVGCGTISHGSSQNVSISSSPAAAQIEIKADNGLVAFTGQTPATAKLSRKNSYTVIIKMAKYKDTQVNISKGVSGMSVLGNLLLCGGPLGLIIDFVNGAINNLEPNSINVTMVTARLGSNNELYAVMSMRGEDNEIRRIAIPMIAQ
jgi:hypothetical protein